MTTLDTVLIDVIMHDLDRAALVRTTEKPGVIVLMFQSAVPSLGVALSAVCHDLGDQPVRLPDGTIHDGIPPNSQPFDERMGVKTIFGHADESPRHWLFFTMPYRKMGEVLGYVFVGDICERVAEICSEHGAPCSLDPDRPAIGYRIVKTKSG